MRQPTVERRTRGACLTAVLTLIAAVVLSVSAAAAEPDHLQKTCDLTGTWYGGSNPYIAWQLHISRTADGGYSASFQQALKWADFGVYSTTGFAGRIEKSGRQFKASAMGMYRLTEEAADSLGVDPGLPEVDVVSGRAEFLTCDTLKFTWNVYYVYYNFDAVAGDKIPFVTPPDIDIIALAGGPLEETYHRLSPPRPTCGAAESTGMSSLSNVLEPRTSRVPPRR